MCEQLLLFTINCIYNDSPREFIDNITHIRLLSWLLLGSLIHTASTKATGNIICQPLQLDVNPHLADHVMQIMSGFAEQSKVCRYSCSIVLSKYVLCVLVFQMSVCLNLLSKSFA